MIHSSVWAGMAFEERRIFLPSEAIQTLQLPWFFPQRYVLFLVLFLLHKPVDRSRLRVGSHAESLPIEAVSVHMPPYRVRNRLMCSVRPWQNLELASRLDGES